VFFAIVVKIATISEDSWYREVSLEGLTYCWSIIISKKVQAKLTLFAACVSLASLSAVSTIAMK